MASAADGETVENIGLHLAGLGLGDDPQGDLGRFGADVIDLDAVFLLEGGRRRARELIDDERRVPGDVPLFLGGVDERLVGRRRRGDACTCGESGHETDRGETEVDCHQRFLSRQGVRHRRQACVGRHDAMAQRRCEAARFTVSRNH